MSKTRLEAFSDGVIAILITLMVLELKVPEDSHAEALWPLVPVFLSYVLSFVMLGIYWNNHHHLIHAVSRVNGAILWANLHLLFWLSLITPMTGWVGKAHDVPLATALYGAVLAASGAAYYILVRVLLHAEGPGSLLARAVGNDFKGKISVVIYLIAIPLAYVSTWIAQGLYVVVALIWLVPDRRIESKIER